MAHIDPVSGQWVADDAGPVPSVPDAGAIGMQVSPSLPPIPPPAPVPAPAPMPPAPPNFIPSGVTLTSNDRPPEATPPAEPPALPAPPPAQAAAPAPVPVLPPVGTLPPARPQLVTSQKLDTPEHVAALKNVDADNAAAVDSSKAAGDLKVQGAMNAAAQADQIATLQQQQADQRAALKEAWDARQAKDSEIIAKATADGAKDPDEGETWTHRLLRALAIGLGQYSAAMNHTSNGAAEIFDADYKQKQQRQKDKIASAQKTGQLTQEQAKEALADLDAKGAGQIQAFQQKWQAESARLGIPQARIDANQTTIGLQKQADEARAKLLNEDRVTVRDMTPAEVRGPKAKGGGGGGDSNALGDFIDRASALKPGETVPRELAALGRKAGFKANQIADQVDKYRNSGGKAQGVDNRANVAGPEGKEQATQIKGVDGEVFGHAPQIGNRLNPEIAHADTRAGNARALIDAFQELRDDVAKNGNNLFPGTVASRNRQALIANIQAAKRVAEALPASEGGLHLEESQMPGSGQLIGLSTSPELIDKSIARIKDKVNQQNRAIVHDAPSGGPASLPDKARTAKAVMNGEPAPARTAQPKAPKVPDAVIEQAKAEVRSNGPHAASARKLLDQQNITVL